MPSTPRHRRLVAAGLAAATVLCGLSVRFAYPRGAASDIAGDALYAVLVYLIVVFVSPRTRPVVVAVIAALLCVAVEVFQLTGLPHAWAATFPPVALVLGTGFDARDILVYLGAVVVACASDCLVVHLRARRRRDSA